MKTNMKQLIEDYERRLRTAESMISDNICSNKIQLNRLKTKASCYRTFLTEMKQALNIADVVISEEQAELDCGHCDGTGSRITAWNTKRDCLFCSGTGTQDN